MRRLGLVVAITLVGCGGSASVCEPLVELTIGPTGHCPSIAIEVPTATGFTCNYFCMHWEMETPHGLQCLPGQDLAVHFESGSSTAVWVWARPYAGCTK